MCHIPQFFDNIGNAGFHKTNSFPFVIRHIVDNDGHLLGVVTKKFNGSKEDAVRVAKEITLSMFKVYPNASNIQSKIQVYNKKGRCWLEISPNFNIIYEI